MDETVGHLDVFHDIACHVSHEVAKVVVVEIHIFGEPEADVLEASGVFRIWSKRRNFTLLELREEPWVLRPEQANVGNGIENHGYALESKAERPPKLVPNIRVVQCWLIDDTTSEDLEPSFTEEDLDFEAWGRPRKGCLDPSYSERVLRRRTNTVTKEGQYEAIEREF